MLTIEYFKGCSRRTRNPEPGAPWGADGCLPGYTFSEYTDRVPDVRYPVDELSVTQRCGDQVGFPTTYTVTEYEYF